MMLLKLPKFLLSNTDWLEKQQSSILSAAMIITVANVAAALSGLLRTRLLISAFFNTSVSTDQAYEALLVAFQIPDMMFQVLVLGAMSAAFIPIFTQMRKKNLEEAFTMSSIVMNLVLLIFILVGVLVFIFARPLTELRTGHTFTPEQVEIATNLTRIMLFAQLFFAISNFLSGIIQSFQRFVIPAIAPVLYNLGILLGVYLFQSHLGIYSAGVGVLIGAFIHMFIQLPLAIKLGYRFKFNFNPTFPGVMRLLKLTPPRFLALGVNEIQNLAFGFFATSVSGLGFVVIRLALTLMTLPIRLFGVPISQASLPFLSSESETPDLERFKSLVIQSINQISFLALPASVLLLILRVPIVRIAFGTHNFPWTTTLTTSRVVAIISLSITAQAITQLVARSFYALEDTRTPLMITVFTVITYIGVCALTVFGLNWGLYGIALATTVSTLLESTLLLVCLNRKLRGMINQSFWYPQIKMLLASFLMAVFLYLPFRILDEVVFNTTRTLELIALTITTGTIGLLVYIYFAALFEIKELQLFVNLLATFNRGKKPFLQSDEVIVETSVGGDEV